MRVVFAAAVPSIVAVTPGCPATGREGAARAGRARTVASHARPVAG